MRDRTLKVCVLIPSVAMESALAFLEENALVLSVAAAVAIAAAAYYLVRTLIQQCSS